MIKRRPRRKRDGLSPWENVVACLCVALVIALAALSVSPQAHGFFHNAEADADHECVITDFAAGEGFFLAPLVVLRPELMKLGVIEREACLSPIPRVPFHSPPSCGPPLAS